MTSKNGWGMGECGNITAITHSYFVRNRSETIPYCRFHNEVYATCDGLEVHSTRWWVGTILILWYLESQERYLQALAQAVVVTVWNWLGIKKLGAIQSKMYCEIVRNPHLCCTCPDTVVLKSICFGMEFWHCLASGQIHMPCFMAVPILPIFLMEVDE